MSLPRLAFIGPTHTVSPWLLQAVRRHGTLEALCDAHSERDAARFQARWTFTDVDALLREAEPDGVVLGAAQGARHRLIKQCLASGANVLLTSAPCSSGMANRLAILAKLSGRVVQASPAIIHCPAALLARRLLDSGRFGRTISLSLRSTRRGSPRDDFDDHGPVPVDQVFEAVSLIQFLLGPLRLVTAMAHGEGVLMAAGMSVENVPVSISLHASGPAEALGVDVEMRSQDGSILTMDRAGGLICRNGSRVDVCHQPSLAASDPVVELGFDALVSEFVRRSRPGGASGLAGPVLPVLAGAEAILASAAKGRPAAPRVARTARSSEPA